MEISLALYFKMYIFVLLVSIVSFVFGYDCCDNEDNAFKSIAFLSSILAIGFLSPIIYGIIVYLF